MSNETQKPDIKKTRLALSNLRAASILAACLAAVVCILLVGSLLFSARSDRGLRVVFDDDKAVFWAEVVRDDAARQRGLSGRTALAADQAMLFVFPAGEANCFWMKDMNFSIDMIWLDITKQVTHIAHNVSPDTYPQSFCPKKASTYVLEVPVALARVVLPRKAKRISS